MGPGDVDTLMKLCHMFHSDYSFLSDGLIEYTWHKVEYL